jgi:predicted O-methyltransferase YrrM
VISAEHLEEIRTAFRDDPLYWRLCSARTQAVLEEIIAYPWFMGVTDPTALGMLGALLQLVQPVRVLQLGTHIGFSAIYFADLLGRNPRPGTLVTVDPESHGHDLARTWAAKAGVSERITFIDGFSTDESVIAAVQARGPYDLVYVDSSHTYAGTLRELALILPPGGWLSEHGLLLLHDVGEFMADYTPELDGGVRRAVLEWLATQPGIYHHLLLEPPLWDNACGLGLIVRRTAPTPSRDAGDVHVEALQQALARSEERAAQLAVALRQLESNWLVRLVTGKLWR